MTPGASASRRRDGRREDGSFDFTQFFANFDLNSDVATYLNDFDPAKFLAELRLASSPPPVPPKGTFGRFARRRSEPSQAAMIDYQAKVDERERAKGAVNKDLAALDDIVNKMDAAHVAGVEQLKQDFTAAKTFIFDAIAHSNSFSLEFHLEGIDELVGSPVLPSTPYTRAPRLGTVDLPVVTPVDLPVEQTEKWPAILTGPTGLAYRIVATPMDVATDAMNYFRIIPPTPLNEIKRSEASPRGPKGDSPTTPGTGKRPSSGWFRSLSSLGSSRAEV
ncbi:hypothetical protein M408DRAFT_331461 [Serendipita vermifera MAFF 305830]|uniref:Uncharacterized protein n=1 Tax=Serendipita vermifera MAFF 305830 TaxID=933852 RepID=A0A0C3AYB3_SERVB|nr:hypothetical protein M408DRAFT_331461 [Serendipita vermifera MAFF 305830]